MVDGFKIAHDLAVVAGCDDIYALYDETQGKEVGVAFAVLIGEDTLPYSEGLKHLIFLRKHEGDPSETVVERLYFELVQFEPSLGLESLHRA